ncbi:MAG: NAD(P)-dependent oxidoreductase [Burkholderiaceae bacterium]|nr:NAD(P)-dependent oxidoreductase [Burkholderiaceae bacterium]
MTAPLRVLLSGRFDAGEREAWAAELARQLPGVQWLDDAAADAAPAGIAAAVVANPAPGRLARLPDLRLIQSLWAGVDKLLADRTLPAHVPIARMVDPAMNAAMAETALWAVLSLHRGFFTYQAQQRQDLWRPLPQQRADEVPVLVLGRGQMGGTAAGRLRAQGYPVQTWGRGDGALAAHLADARIVVNLLPLTPETRGLLDARAFAALPRGAALVNLARGAHVVDADLLAALADGQLAHAVLDVFHAEPLPAGHPYWQHPQVTMLPHAAAATDERSAAAVVAANLHALASGAPIAHLVDRSRGY